MHAALFLLSLAWISGDALAAPCCGAGSAAPTIITGDDSAQISASISHGDIIGETFPNGTARFRATGDDEISQTFRLDGALLLSDRWQAGLSLPIVRRAHSIRTTSDSATGLGDVSVSTAYEILPEWDYSVWKPRGFLFGQFTFPTGGSVHDVSLYDNDSFGLGARGMGFYNVSVGALFTKSWGGWDAYSLIESHWAFSRTFGELTVSPGLGGSVALAAGYSPNALPIRFGLALSPAYETGNASTENGISANSIHQLVWNASAQLAWLVHRSATLSAIYTDQTLIGPAINHDLRRTFALTFQKRWER